MRGSRSIWLWFAVGVAVAVAVIPIGVARSRNAAVLGGDASSSAHASATAPPAGWVPYTPADRSFTVTGPDGARASVLNTSMGPANQTRFGDGSYSVTWLRTAVGVSDSQALQQAKIGLLRPLVGRLADEEVDLEDNGHPGFGLVITVENTTYDVRLFAAEGKVFQVVGAAAAASTQLADAAAFVGSFQLA